MKFKTGEQAILLDTEYKPAGNAVIKFYNADTKLYKVEFRYANKNSVIEVEVPEDRLVRNSDSNRTNTLSMQ
ncbi:MAG TPA: hypothetical protein VGP55_10910 [Chitinophagaceae bacterium]|nr:hypothetical protein [Chitinophagaceae bacterium]